MVNNKGFTLIELLASIIIISLVSGGLVAGVILSNNQYKDSIRQSEASELYNTISSLLTNELKYTNQIQLDSNDNVIAFKSISYQVDSSPLCQIDVVYSSGYPTKRKYGYIALGDNTRKNLLVGESTYPNDLGAKLSITYDSTLNMFKVNLDIGYDDKSIIQHPFDVRCLNNVEIISE